jgi:hypothetical protein
MRGPWCCVLERAEFDAMETAVRYCEGKASAAELEAATARLRALTARITHEHAKHELFVFPRRPRPSRQVSGH